MLRAEAPHFPVTGGLAIVASLALGIAATRGAASAALMAAMAASAAASLGARRLVRAAQDEAWRAAAVSTVADPGTGGAAATRPPPRIRLEELLALYLASVALATATLQAAFLRIHAEAAAAAAFAMAFLAGCLVGEWLLPADRNRSVAAVGLATVALAVAARRFDGTGALAPLLRPGGDPGGLVIWLSVCAALTTGLVGAHEIRALLAQRRGMLGRLQGQDLTIDVLLDDRARGAADWLWESDAGARVVSIRPRPDAGDLPAADRLLAFDWNRWMADGRSGDGAAAGEFRRLVAALRRRVGYRGIALPIALPGEADSAPREMWLSLSARPLFDETGAFRGYRGVASDITARREAALQDRHRATHDRATGLVNRRAFHALVRERLARDAGGFLVLVLDLDGFKLLNLQHGHETGDLVLRAVGQRLTNLVRQGDVVCRLQGDQFALMVLEADPADGLACAERVARHLGQPYRLGDRHFMLRASVGVAAAPAHGRDPTGLMHAADVALISARTAGPGNVRMFLPTMEEEANERRALQVDLAVATARCELSVAYQPVIDLADGRMVAAEALLRWNHPIRGPVPPSTFIGVAEEAGLIGGIGRFALAEACREAAAWPEHVRVAVNVSPLQFREPGFARGVASAMREAAIGPRRLELEVTESVMMEAGTQIGETLAELRAAGVQVVLDDFGTGFASLGYLQRFPFDRIKIDRSFVAQMAGSEGARAIVRAIVALARGLGMQTTAEGVETEAQLRLLVELGCTHAQGYLFSRPIAPSLLRAELRAGAGFALPA